MAETLRPKARFRLRTALVAILAIASLLASYRVGYEHGRQRGPMVPITIKADEIYQREYDVSDIAKSEADAELLIGSLRKLVQPDDWDAAGGYAEISYIPGSNALAVAHVWSGHTLVVKHLSIVRDFAARSTDLEQILSDVKSNW